MEIVMTERVTGPASYFPSIEKKYGKPVSYWLDLINSSPLTKHKAPRGLAQADYGSRRAVQHARPRDRGTGEGRGL
jgi:hypothetical protein